jgi:hypothetical protein
MANVIVAKIVNNFTMPMDEMSEQLGLLPEER